MKTSISVIIPNYNGRHLLEMYLPTVIDALRVADVPNELIIVDDQSKDDSIDFIRRMYPDILLLVNEKNSGFSFTCNQGIKIAQMELTLLLNSDVKLTSDYFEKQWKYFEKTDTFGVMGRIMSKDGQKIEDAARILFFKGCRIKANRFYYSNDPTEQVYTAYLSGANALINTKKLKELKGFDEIYSPFTSEDYDLSIRAWLIGWKCYYEHHSICYHQVSGSIRKNLQSNFIKQIYFRNRFIFNGIHLTKVKALIWPMHLFLLEILPRVLTGKLWIFQSFRDYRWNFNNIRDSKIKLNKLKLDHKSTLEIEDIIQLINGSLKGKSIVRF